MRTINGERASAQAVPSRASASGLSKAMAIGLDLRLRVVSIVQILTIPMLLNLAMPRPCLFRGRAVLATARLSERNGTLRYRGHLRAKEVPTDWLRR